MNKDWIINLGYDDNDSKEDDEMIAPGFNSQSPLDEETPNKKTV